MRLRPVIDRFGGAIEFDLWERGDNLLEYFSPAYPLKTWRRLAVILDQLPRTSRYVIAKKNDPEVALEVARALREQRATGGGGGYRPPPEEWDTLAELTALAADRLGEVEALLADLPIAGKKRKAKPPKRVARPETAIERAEAVLAEEHVTDIIADVEAAYVSDEEYAAEVAAQERYRAEQAAQAGDAPAPPDGDDRG